jgi:AbrB family looped-hinge helix DNA binding protein
MMTTKLSTKGQIVIPVEFRERYNLEPGSKVELMDIGGEIVIIPLILKNPIEEARGFLKGGRSTKELLKAIRKEERKIERTKK